MKWLPLLVAGFRRKPARSILTLLSIVVAFLLVGIMTGLNASLQHLFDQTRIDRIIVVPRFGGQLPIAYVDQIARLPGVTKIVPSGLIGGTYQNRNNPFGAIMTDARVMDVHPELGITPEGFAALANVRQGMILSRALADRINLRVGDNFPIESQLVRADRAPAWTFQVIAVVPDHDLFPAGFAVGNYAYLDEGRAEEKGTVEEIRLLVDDQDRAVAIGAAIERLFANSPAPVTALTERTTLETALARVIDLDFFTRGVSAAALFMILFLAANVMAQSVRERIPEFAVMKTIGFSDRTIFALVLVEAAVPSLIGAVLGLVLAQVLPDLMRRALPNLDTLMPMITTGVVITVLAAAFAVALVSGLPSAWRLKRLSIAEAIGRQ